MCFRKRVTCGYDSAENDALFVDRAQKVKTGLELKLWLVRLDDRRNLRDVDILGTDVVGAGHLGNVDVYLRGVQNEWLAIGQNLASSVLLLTMLAVDLVLGNDELYRVRVVRVGNRVLKDADRANDEGSLASAAGSAEVAGVADEHVCLDGLVA